MTKIVLTEHAEINAKGKSTKHTKGVVRLRPTWKVYGSVEEAAKDNGISQSHLSNILNNRFGTSKGIKFCYLKDIVNHLDEITEMWDKHGEFILEREREMEAERERQNLIAQAREKYARCEAEFCKARDKAHRAYEKYQKSKSAYEKADIEFDVISQELYRLDREITELETLQ